MANLNPFCTTLDKKTSTPVAEKRDKMEVFLVVEDTSCNDRSVSLHGRTASSRNTQSPYFGLCNKSMTRPSLAGHKQFRSIAIHPCTGTDNIDLATLHLHPVRSLD